MVSHGRLLVDGVPLHESSIARDPAFRGGSAEPPRCSTARAPVVRLGLDDVRAGHEKIAHVLEQHPGALFASDAETDEDLASLAAAALAVARHARGRCGRSRPCGALALGLAAPPAPLPPGPARLVRGRQPSPRQPGPGRRARRAGVAVVDRRRSRPATSDSASRRSGRAAGGGDERDRHDQPPARRAGRSRGISPGPPRACSPARAADLVAVTGGDTAVALIEALRPRRFELLGAPADGLALGRLALDRRATSCRCSPRRAASAARSLHHAPGRNPVTAARVPVLGITMGDPAGVGPRDHRQGAGPARGRAALPRRW